MRTYLQFSLRTDFIEQPYDCLLCINVDLVMVWFSTGVAIILALIQRMCQTNIVTLYI